MNRFQKSNVEGKNHDPYTNQYVLSPSPLLLNLGNFKQGEIKHRKLNDGEQKVRKRRPTELCGHVVQADVVGGGGGVGAVGETGQEPVAQQAQTLLLPAHPPLTLLPVFNILFKKNPPAIRLLFSIWRAAKTVLYYRFKDISNLKLFPQKLCNTIYVNKYYIIIYVQYILTHMYKKYTHTYILYMCLFSCRHTDTPG